MLSENDCNMLMCRMPDVNEGVTCIKLLCKTCGRRYDGCRLHGGAFKPPSGQELWCGAWLRKEEWCMQVNAVLNARCMKHEMPFANEGDETNFPEPTEFVGETPAWMRAHAWSMKEAKDRLVYVCIPEYNSQHAEAEQAGGTGEEASRDDLMARAAQRREEGARP